MIIKHYNSRTAQTENNSELELVKIELELKNTKAIAQVKSASIALNTALFVNNIHQVSPWTSMWTSTVRWCPKSLGLNYFPRRAK